MDQPGNSWKVDRQLKIQCIRKVTDTVAYRKDQLRIAVYSSVHLTIYHSLT